jgi:hypothetical protein
MAQVGSDSPLSANADSPDFQKMEMKQIEQELTIIQKMYDLIMWYVPIINRFPRDHKFTLGERIESRQPAKHSGTADDQM